jgi:hypothetical protein
VRLGAQGGWQDERMTMAGTDLDARAEIRTSAALTTGLVVVHLVMAYYVFSLSDAIFDLVIRLSGQELARMMVTLAPAVPLALVVLFWARDRTLGWIACLVVVATALLPYVRNVVVERLYEAGDMSAVDTWAEWSGWVLVVLLPIGAALGWGIARRRGTSWWPGLLVGGAVAALAYWLDIDPPFGDDGQLRAMTLAFVYHVVPVVLGCLACWWLEVRNRG